jgi:hypothetical protein
MPQMKWTVGTLTARTILEVVTAVSSSSATSPLLVSCLTGGVMDKMIAGTTQMKKDALM